MNKRINVCSLFVVFCMVVACSNSVSTDSTLQATTWILVDLNGQVPLEGTAVTLKFAEDEVMGDTGCNTFGGNYVIDGSEIIISDVYNTEMGCMDPEGIMEQEINYLDILREVRMFELAGDVLMLTANERAALTFEKSSSEMSSQTVVEDANEVVSVTNPTVEEVVETMQPPEYSVLFLDDSSKIGFYIPEQWVVSQTFPGEYTILQSYPIDKYAGGELLEASDTKCDLTYKPEYVNPEVLIEEWESDPMIELTSVEMVDLESGIRVHRVVLENMGTALVYVFDSDSQVMTLTCFGNFSPVDRIASTLHRIVD